MFCFSSTTKSFKYINNKSKWKFEVISTTPIITILFKLTLSFYPLTLNTKLLVIYPGGHPDYFFRNEWHEIFKHSKILELGCSLPIWAKSCSNLPIREETDKKKQALWKHLTVRRSIEFDSVHHCWSCKFDYVVISYLLNLILASFDIYQCFVGFDKKLDSKLTKVRKERD